MVNMSVNCYQTQDPCAGDSGGPLMIQDKTTSRWTIIGWKKNWTYLFAKPVAVALHFTPVCQSLVGLVRCSFKLA